MDEKLSKYSIYKIMSPFGSRYFELIKFADDNSPKEILISKMSKMALKALLSVENLELEDISNKGTYNYTAILVKIGHSDGSKYL